MEKGELQPSNHTRLMNYIIGMCKKHRDWITVLADLGYDPHLIEKNIRTSAGERIKPDIIVTSTQLIHSLVFDVKGGITVDKDQLDRYTTLDKADLYRWVETANPMFTIQNFQFDLCIGDLEQNHPPIAAAVKNVPIITFGSQKIEKTGQFQKAELNKQFREPLSLVGKIPPLFYYPFSENDQPAYIAPFVIRGLLSIALKRHRGGPSVFDKSVITNEQILKAVFNPIFDALASEHQGRLKDIISDVFEWIMSDDGMKEAFGSIERQGGYKLRRPLDRLISASNKFIANLETQGKLDSFL
jgi:hypothetical protein